MPIDEYFDPSYVNSSGKTTQTKKKSETKTLLKETTNEEDMSRYGSSKPKRIVIKAKITNG